MNLTALLASKHWRPIFKPLAKALDSNDAALMFSELCNSHEYFKERNQLTSDGWFFCTVDYLQEEINLSKHQQLRCGDLLEKAGLIEKQLRGMPAQRYFRIAAGAENILQEMISMVDNKKLKNRPTSSQEIEPQEVKKAAGNEIVPNEIKKINPTEERPAGHPTKQEDFNKKNSKAFKAENLQDIANELLIRGFHHDTTVNRQAAWLMLQDYIKTNQQDFKNIWDFITMGLPEHNREAVLQAWVIKAEWGKVRGMKLHQARGWVETEIKKQLNNQSNVTGEKQYEGNSW